MKISNTVKLGFSIAVMYSGFLLFFILQESLLPKKNPNPDSFNFPNCLLFICDIFYMLSGLVSMLVTKATLPKNPLPYITVSIPLQISAATVNYASKYINYPTFQLLKSAKPLSVMLCQLFVFRQKIDTKKVIVVIILSIGLAIFGANGNFEGNSYYGFLWAFFGLFMDAIYVPLVDRLKKNGGGPFAILFYNYMWSALLVLVVAFADIRNGLLFIVNHPEVLPKIIMYGLSGSVAQIALFTAIGLSDGLVVAIATTTRKLFTIVLSSIFFGHSLNVRQWIGVALVFFALGIEILLKRKKNHVKEDPEDSKNK